MKKVSFELELYLRNEFPILFQTQSSYYANSYNKPVPTIEAITPFLLSGWHISDLICQSKRNILLKGYEKHTVRLRNEKFRFPNGDYIELIFTNLYDHTRFLKVNFGYFRGICSNNLIFGDSFFESIIKHADDQEQVIEDINVKLSDSINKIGDLIYTMKNYYTDRIKKNYLAKAAMLSVYGSESEFPYIPGHLLISRRVYDNAPDLWTTYNVIQENFIKGGFSYNAKNTGRLMRAREVTNIDKRLKFNCELWNSVVELAITDKFKVHP